MAAGRVVALGALAAALLTSARARADESSARSDTATPATDIVRVAGPKRELPSTTTQTLSEREMERGGATNVEQALALLPAVQAASDARGERTINLQGFTQRQVAVFVDGVPVLVPYDGQLDLAKFPIDMIDRVTVVKGSAATLYGPNGLGGAVSMTTRDPSARTAWAKARTEGNAYSVRSSLAASGRAGDAAAIAGASLETVRFVPMPADFGRRPNEDGGRRNNSDRRGGSFALKGTLDLSDAHRLVVTASRFEGTFGVPPATRDFTVRYWRWTDWYASTIGVGHEYRGTRTQTEAQLYTSFVGNTLDGYDDATYRTQRLSKALHSVYDDVTVGGFVRVTADPDALGALRPRLRAWAGARRDMHASHDNTSPDEVHVATSTLTLSGMGEIDVVPRTLRAAAGASLDAELPDAPPTGPTPPASAAPGPMGSLTWLAATNLTVTASAAARTRFPTLRERFSTVFGTRDPNPGLGPEHAVNLGLDVAYRPVRPLTLAAGLFDSEVDDLITAVIVGPGGTDRQENVGRARFYGAEGEARLALSEIVELRGGVLFMHAGVGPDRGDKVAYRPRQKGVFLVTVRPVPRLALTGGARYVGAQDYQNPDTGVWGRLDGYGLFDARAELEIVPRVLKGFARLSNLFDANVEGRYSFPEAGRQVFFGVSGEVPR